MTATISPVEPCTCSDHDEPHQHCVIHGVYTGELCLECEEENRDTAPDEDEDRCECGRALDNCLSRTGSYRHADLQDPTADYDAEAKGMDI